MLLTSETIERLRVVQSQIKAEPELLNMENYFNVDCSFGPCGTTACIGGRLIANVLNKSLADARDAVVFDFKNNHATARTGHWAQFALFGFPFDTDPMRVSGIQVQSSTCLFHLDYWPTDLRDDYRSGCTETRAETTIKRIERFIESDGKL